MTKINFIPFTELVAEIIDNRGKTCPVSPNGLPLIATNCIKNDALYPSYETNRFVSDETYKTWFRGHPKAGDLIFVTKGTPGRVCIAPNPVDFCIAQDMVAVRANESKIYPKYLFAVLRSEYVQKEIENMHVGTLIPHFKKGDFHKLKLPVPDEDAQILIGDTYYNLSNKIELNRQMNRGLEAMARAVFKAWFVDFEPVRANSQRRPSESASPEIAKLFPSEFENGIPKGWQMGKLGGVLEARGGTTPSTKESKFWKGENFWATPKDLSNLRFPVLLTTERKITDEGVRQISSGILPKGTLLLSSRAPIGYLAISQIPVAINQGFIAIQGKTLSNLFLLHWLTENMEAVKSRSNGSTFQ